MKYSEHYNQYYNKIYSLVEYKIKKYFIGCKVKKLLYGHSYNELLENINKYLKTRITEKNANIKELYDIFKNRDSKYSEDEIDCIIENDILIIFQKLNKEELTKINSIFNLIKEFALKDVLKEITRLLQNNSRLFELMYDLNEFDKFEIKYYRQQRLEHTDIFICLNKRIYPELYLEKTIQLITTNNDENSCENLYTSEKTILIDLVFTTSNWTNLSVRKKSRIISLIIGSNPDNIRNTLAKLEIKQSLLSDNFKNKIKEMEDKLKNLG